jgi:hypothetical protein
MTEAFVVCVFGTKVFSKSSGNQAEKLPFYGCIVPINEILRAYTQEKLTQKHHHNIYSKCHITSNKAPHS